MTDALALLLVLAVAVVISQLWLFVDGVRRLVLGWLYEWLQWREWEARDRAAIAARKARESARWEEQGRVYALDFDTNQVREITAALPVAQVPNGWQWRGALRRAVGWGDLVGWTERAWRDNRVVYLPDTGEHYETGRRQVIAELDALGITAGGALGRTWAAGMGYQAALDLLDSTPPAPKWENTPPPAVKIPHEGAKVRSYEPSKE